MQPRGEGREGGLKCIILSSYDAIICIAATSSLRLDGRVLHEIRLKHHVGHVTSCLLQQQDTLATQAMISTVTSI